MKAGPVAATSILVLAAAAGMAAAWLHLLRPPRPRSPITVLVGAVSNTNKDPL